MIPTDGVRKAPQYEQADLQAGRGADPLDRPLTAQGSRRIRQQDAWAKDIFPVAHERLKQAAAAIDPGTPAQPLSTR